MALRLFFEQAADFPFGSHDDALDAMATAIDTVSSSGVDKPLVGQAAHEVKLKQLF